MPATTTRPCTRCRCFRRLHALGLIAKIPRTRRWRVTDCGRKVTGPVDQRHVPTWLRARVREGRLRSADVSQARAEFIGMLSEAFLMPRLLIPGWACSAAVARKRIGSVVETFLARYRAGG